MQGFYGGVKKYGFHRTLMFLFVFGARALEDQLKFVVRICRRAGGVSFTSHIPLEHWLTVHRGPGVSRPGRCLRQVEAEHRYTVGTLQLGFSRDFLLRNFLGVWIIHS